MKLPAALILVTALAGCKPAAAKIEVMPNSLKFNSSGDTAILITNLSDKNGAPIQQHDPCAFVTGEALIADVRQDGTVTANGAGATEIKVVCNKLVAVVPVKVSLPAKVVLEPRCVERCDQVSADPLSLKLVGIGAAAKLTARVVDEAGEPVPVEPRWEVSDPTYREGARRLGVELGKDGELRSTGLPGKYLVLVTAGTVVGRALVEVTLPQVDVVKAQGHVWVKPGGEAQLEPKGFRRAVEGLKPVLGGRYTYNSNNPAVARVTDEGKVIGVAEGTADVVIAAESGSFAQVTVTVSEKDPLVAPPPRTPKPKGGKKR